VPFVLPDQAAAHSIETNSPENICEPFSVQEHILNYRNATSENVQEIIPQCFDDWMKGTMVRPQG